MNHDARRDSYAFLQQAASYHRLSESPHISPYLQRKMSERSVEYFTEHEQQRRQEPCDGEGNPLPFYEEEA